MNILLKALMAFAPACVLFLSSVLLFMRTKAVFSFMELLGSGGFMLVASAHICEALGLFPWMNWGHEQSVGHYLDLSGAALGLVLFPTGHLLHVLRKTCP